MKKEERELLIALALMWNQYCGRNGHSSMTAGEEASSILIKYGFLKDEYSEVNIEDIENRI